MYLLVLTSTARRPNLELNVDKRFYIEITETDQQFLFSLKMLFNMRLLRTVAIPRISVYVCSVYATLLFYHSKLSERKNERRIFDFWLIWK